MELPMEIGVARKFPLIFSMKVYRPHSRHFNPTNNKDVDDIVIIPSEFICQLSSMRRLHRPGLSSLWLSDHCRWDPHRGRRTPSRNAAFVPALITLHGLSVGLTSACSYYHLFFGSPSFGVRRGNLHTHTVYLFLSVHTRFLLTIYWVWIYCRLHFMKRSSSQDSVAREVWTPSPARHASRTSTPPNHQSIT